MCVCVFLIRHAEVVSVTLTGTYSAGGMAGAATWNCSRLGASSVYTTQPCTMSLHAIKPHTYKVYACLGVTCHLHCSGSMMTHSGDRDLLRATAITRDIVQELCESRGGRPGLSVLTSLLVSVDVKIYWTVLRHWSQLVPNMSTDIWGH